MHTYTSLLLKLARAFTLVLHVALRRSAAIHVHRRSACAIRLKACNDDRTKRRSRCARRHCVVPNLEPNLCTYTSLAQACKSVHLACFTLICDAQQLTTDAAIHRRSARTAHVLSTSRRVAKTARSGVHDVHVGTALSRTKPVHVHEHCSSLQERCVPHVALRRSAAIHVHRRSACAIRLKACNDDRTKRRSRCARRHCVVPNLEPNLCTYTSLAQACKSVHLVCGRWRCPQAYKPAGCHTCATSPQAGEWRSARAAPSRRSSRWFGCDEDASRSRQPSLYSSTNVIVSINAG